jgi:protein-tyrosine phosphatase
MQFVEVPLARGSLFLSLRPGYPKIGKIDEKILADYIGEVKHRKIGLVVVLMTSEEIQQKCGIDIIAHYRSEGFEVFHFPIDDHEPPLDVDLFDQLQQLIWNHLQNRNVLIHCNAGCGRTGTVAAGLLIHSGKAKTVKGAITTMRKYKPCAVETTGQEDFLEAYLNRVQNKKA